MLSGEVFRRDLRTGLANADVERDNNVSIGQMTSSTNVIMYLQHQQDGTNCVCFTFVLPSFRH